MPNDIFKYNAEYSGAKVITASKMILTVNGPATSKKDYLVQNVTIQYSRPIQSIRELSSGNIYSLGLPPIGNLSVGRIVGETPITSVLGPPGEGIFTTPGNSSSSDTDARLVTLSPVGGAKGPTYKCYGCVVESYNVNTDANAQLVQEAVTIRFGLLEAS